MKAIKKIMLPFDFSEAAINALDYALKLTEKENDLEILALQVMVNPVSGTLEQRYEVEFKKVLLNLNRRSKTRPRLLTVSGNLMETLLQTQIDQEIDLVIMGTMGDREAQEAITNTSKLVSVINAPVLVVPYGCAVKVPREIALLIGNERIEQPALLEMLLDIARTFDSKVHVLTIFKESILAEYGNDEQTEDTLAYYLEHFFAEHHFKKDDNIEEGIVDYIGKRNIDLLTIMPRNHLIKAEPSEGRLTRMLTLHSDIPILVLD